MLYCVVKFETFMINCLHFLSKQCQSHFQFKKCVRIIVIVSHVIYSQQIFVTVNHFIIQLLKIYCLIYCSTPSCASSLKYLLQHARNFKKKMLMVFSNWKMSQAFSGWNWLHIIMVMYTILNLTFWTVSTTLLHLHLVLLPDTTNQD